MKKARNHNFLSMLTGVLLGAALFGGGTALASSGVMATPSTQAIYVDGERVNMTAYSIGGNNYVKLRDVGKAVDFNVSYDAATQSVQIDSDAPYVEETPAAPAAPATSTAPAGAISVPQTDAAPFVPKEGDVILCDNGTTYKVTDMSHYDNNLFAKDKLGPLPTPTCDWSQFPEVELPKVETRHFNDSTSDRLFILNLYEMRRMQYTAYNAIGANPQLWKDGKLATFENGSPITRIELGIPDDADSDYIGSFWPWRDSEITKDFGIRPPNNYPGSLYQFEAWDVYVNGIFQHTMYNVY